MFEDDNFDTEFLGAAQRNRNLKEVEATRKEIVGLRADIKRRENEERAAPKCPYCAGPIADGVIKCRHCASDIKWCEVSGRSYPLKAGVNVEQFVAQKTQEFQRAKKLQQTIEYKRALNSPIWDVKTPFILGVIYFSSIAGSFFFLDFLGIIAFIINPLFVCLGVKSFLRVYEIHSQNERNRERKQRVLAEVEREAAEFVINCPICKQELNVTPSPHERKVQCGHCSENFIIPAGSVCARKEEDAARDGAGFAKRLLLDIRVRIGIGLVAGCLLVFKCYQASVSRAEEERLVAETLVLVNKRNLNYHLSPNYELEHYVVRNYSDKQASMLMSAAENGNLEAEVAYGYYMESQGDYDKALKFYTRAANQGSSSAMFRLGVMNLEGLGLDDERPKSAVYWFSESGEHEAESIVSRREAIKQE
ncbi:hypothetical protein N8640_05430, partial [Akkermansiaceae bacterium]|nr:hypothetical protein [Akkermansiaceae bacterium]MDA7607915.1 hypothetical protein [Akkermansiaceae bacterium]